MNSLGHLFRITTFGESHGPAIGVVVDGCPAGLDFDLDFIQKELDRRRPGQSHISTQRKESDTAQLMSGVFEGRTLGTPIALLIPNEDARGRDYDHLATAFRPSHADFTWQEKFGHRDHRGGGRSSARETASWVAAGAVAKLFLRAKGVEVQAFVQQVGEVAMPDSAVVSVPANSLPEIESTPVRCPHPETATAMISLIEEVKKAGDTVGGVVFCRVSGCPAVLGEPVFGKLHAELGRAMLTINAAKGFEIGSGFAGAAMRGSAHNDLFFSKEGKIQTATNRSGGIQGGISNGMDIDFRVAFKPVATIMRPQETVNEKGEAVEIAGRGRHDPCVVPRAVPIVEAMAALVVADFMLLARGARL